ncbi:MAG: RnfABCDGE type electron transport complex subunit A [Clostridia bacterium]|nr:RnfABCDGE type electron transport complex subunit A [Clostridia bacterium]MDD7700977.1 RnfABCDGE type electron transport complex subunit A [Eubacteriales bacterium]MDY2827055.1 RnfABCDGE type electron transport complex subunit A [Eubacteriales bacterium]
MSFGEILLMMFSAILVENFIFAKFYGCCPFLGVSDKPDTALGMGLAVTFVMTLSGAATYAVYHFILLPLGLTYLKTVAFILVIAALVQFIEMFLRRFIPALYGALGIYLPLITTNCAVLSAALLAVQNDYGFGASVAFGFASALGFTLAIVVFAGVRKKMAFAEPPRAFRGFPITLIAAGLLAMAFAGFAGVHL